MICPSCQTNNTDGASRCLNCGADLTRHVPSVGNASNQASSQFGQQLTTAIEQWKAQLGDLVVLTLVFLLVAWIPIISLAFVAGYVRAILKVSRGQGRAEIADIFNAWDSFGRLLVFGLALLIVSFILNWIPLLGQLATLLLGFLAFPGAWRMVDRNATFTEALSWGVAAIQQRPVDWLLTYLAGGVLVGVGMMLFGVGLLFTLPLATLLCTLQYRACQGD